MYKKYGIENIIVITIWVRNFLRLVYIGNEKSRALAFRCTWSGQSLSEASRVWCTDIAKRPRQGLSDSLAAVCRSRRVGWGSKIENMQ